MHFVRLLRPELVALDPPWRGFRDTVSGLVALLVSAGALPPERAGEAVQAVLQREDDASTAVVDIDVGVPHARLDGLAQPVVAFAVSAAGFYEPVPTVPIHIVALVLSPRNATDRHLQLLANVATLLRSDELRATLRRAAGPATVVEALGLHARSAP